MKYGSISTGSKEASNTALEILKFGGNAFDAAIGAIFVSMTSEFALTGAFGGGTLLGIQNNSSPFIYDFFVDCPNCQTNDKKDFKEIEIDFGNAKQKFNIGKGSIAIPGNLIGLINIQKKYGCLDIKDILEYGINYANQGIVINKNQSEIIKLIEPILLFDKAGQELYSNNNSIMKEGDIFKNPQFANFLNTVIKKGYKYFYEGSGLDLILSHCGKDSFLTKNGFQKYQVKKRVPLAINYKGYEIFTNPAPSFGGSLIIFLLKLLKDTNNKINVKNLIQSMNLASLVREEICTNPNDEYQINNIFNDNVYNKYLNFSANNFADNLNGFGSTTHVSVLDKNGNAASITTTNGEGCGYVIPEYGIMMNNMLGEEDLNPFGFHKWDIKRRLPTMISPTIISKNNIPEYVLGSGGSNRIRSANIQVILNLIEKNMNLNDAIENPRIHLEGKELYCEPGIKINSEEIINQLSLKLFKEKNVFFGGVNAVSKTEAIGDSRRGGCGIIN